VRDPTFWILARASGLTAYLLLTLSVLAGLTVKSKPFGKAVRIPTVTDLHRFLALLGLGAVAIHGITLVLDSTIKITPAALLVPGLVPYRPVWTSLGVLSAELMLVVYVSFALRKRIGVRNWRRLHYATFAIFAAATLHGLLAGTDTSHRWAIWLYASAVGAVVAATTWRALTAGAARSVPVRSPRPSPVPATETSTGGTPR
jgi:methionine sulfoxide reductase heme-binding subunit